MSWVTVNDCGINVYAMVLWHSYTLFQLELCRAIELISSKRKIHKSVQVLQYVIWTLKDWNSSYFWLSWNRFTVCDVIVLITSGSEFQFFEAWYRILESIICSCCLKVRSSVMYHINSVDKLYFGTNPNQHTKGVLNRYHCYSSGLE